MKVVILAGGYGSRISEESHLKPKPMITIGEKPMLWHIMKTYSHYSCNDFIICLGYKGYCITEYFANYMLQDADVTFDFGSNKTTVHNQQVDPWRVTLVQTGLETQTGSRIKKVQKYVGGQTFMLTYGDGLSNVDMNELLKFHKSHGKIATVTAVSPPGRFGSLDLNRDNLVSAFIEKPFADGNWINGGFFVCEPELFDYIPGDTENCVFERAPLENLARDGQLVAYKHQDFWHAMDTLRDKRQLEALWENGDAPWQVWKKEAGRSEALLPLAANL